MKTYVHTKPWGRMFIAVLFITGAKLETAQVTISGGMDKPVVAHPLVP